MRESPKASPADLAPAAASIARHAGVPGVDLERLRCAGVIVAGAGNIGSYLADLLARAGIGWLGIVDRDRVTAENCDNQNCRLADVGRPKAEALAHRLREQVPTVTVEPFVADLQDVPLGHFNVDAVFGGLDSRRARQTLISDIAWPLGVPVVDGGVGAALVGRVQVFVPAVATACLECTWGEADYRALATEYPCSPGETLDAPPTLSPACAGAMVASVMAAECLRILAGQAADESREIAFDLWHRRFLTSKLRRAPGCRFDHERVTQTVRLGTDFPSATLGDVLHVVEERFGNVPVHFECRRGLFPGRFASPTDLASCARQHLSTLGFQPADRIRVRSAASSVFLCLDGESRSGCERLR
jgi:molybdopterin/thiamine biosynthesis adenylyltransferase